MSPEDRKQLVIERARELFVEHGYTGTSTAMIAKSADISEMTLFRYFPHKRDVFMSAIQPVLEVFTPEQDSSDEAKRGAVDTVLWTFLQRRMEFIQGHRKLVMLVLIESHLQSDLAGEFSPVHQVQTQLHSMLQGYGITVNDARLVIRLTTALLMAMVFSPSDTKLDEAVSARIFGSIQAVLQRGGGDR